MHYYKKNIGDYHKKAGRLNMLQHGAYTLLMDSCYDRERFPTLEEAIEWCWASSEDEKNAVKLVLDRFFDLVDGVYVQYRIQDELEKFAENSKTNSKIAKAREAKKRKITTNRDKITTNRERTVNEPCENNHALAPNHKPLTINQEPLKDLSSKPDISDSQKAFNYWVLKMVKGGSTKFTKKRKSVVNARLKEGYLLSDIFGAIDGCLNSSYHMGQNDTGTVYNDLELICRTGEKVEHFRDNINAVKPLAVKQELVSRASMTPKQIDPEKQKRIDAEEKKYMDDLKKQAGVA